MARPATKFKTRKQNSGFRRNDTRPQGRLDRLDALRGFGYSFRYSRSRRVCVRLTGISVDFSSFIRRM